MKIRRPIAGSGRVLSSQDYKAGELITHAQSCIWLVGHSDLATLLLKKIDPHASFAMNMLGLPYTAYDKKILQHYNLRQAAKPFVFSKPGGGGVPTILLQQRKQGEDTPHPDGPSLIDDGKGNMIRGFKGMRFCTVMRGEYCGKHMSKTWGSRGRERAIKRTCSACLECGRELETAWKQQYSENVAMNTYVSNCVDNGMTIEPAALERWPWLHRFYQPYQQLEPQQIMQHWSGRLRKVGQSAETPFCVLSNSFFQAPIADATKLAHRICTRECFDKSVRVPSMLFQNSIPSQFAGMESPLVGSTIPVFAHDELLGDHPESIAHEAATRISEVMRDCLRYICPDLADAVEARPTLMENWYKAAEEVVHRGRTVPWTPGHDPKKCAECLAPRTI